MGLGRWGHWWRGLLGWLRSRGAALVWAEGCALCRQRAVAGGLCRRCRERLLACRLTEPIQGDRLGDVPVWVWGRYGGALRSAIAAWKYQHRRSLTQTFGDAMADGSGSWLLQRKRLTKSGKPIPPRRPLLVPVPLHRDRLKQRGFNQAELLARRMGDRLGLAVAPRGLVRTRATAAQFNLKLADRRRNLAGAFDLGPDLRDRAPQPVVIVDDLYTSGTTAREAATVLQRRGWPVLAIVALARPPRRDRHQAPNAPPSKGKARPPKPLAPRPPKP